MEASFERSIRIPALRLKSLKVRSNKRGWVQTGSHICAIVLCTFILVQTWGTWSVIPFFMIQGILINCLYAGVHELSHNTVFTSQRLNEFFGRLFCFVLLIGRDQDKFEHYQHHRHTQDIELDAEIIGGKPFTLQSYIIFFLGFTYWPGRVSEVVRMAFGQTKYWPYLSEIQFRVVHREARILLLMYTVIAATCLWVQTTAAVYFWLLPMMSMKWFHMMQNIAEHTSMPHENDIWVNTRTLKPNPIMNWLLWNMPYHTAHHTYPIIPFHRLPELHEEIVLHMKEEPQTISHLGFQVQMIKKLWKEGSSAYSGKDIVNY